AGIEGPAVRGGAVDEFLPGLRQGDVERALAELCAFHQEAQRDGGLARAGVAFEEEQGTSGEASGQDVIEAFNAGRSLGTGSLGRGMRYVQISPPYERPTEAVTLKVLKAMHRGGEFSAERSRITRKWR